MHFIVYVFHDADTDIDTLLAPYDENRRVDRYLKYTKQEAMVHAKDMYHKRHPEWSMQECYDNYVDGEDVDEHGNIYSTYNPLSQWDWYQTGGRWSGDIKTKNGEVADETELDNVDFSKQRIPWAFVDADGEWHQHGEMGWFGSTEEKTEEEWNREFMDYVKTLPGDTLITAVDCHI